MNKNCQILVKQRDGDIIKVYQYDFDDYRIATAVCNLLCNMGNVNMNLYIREDECDDPRIR